MLSAFPTGGSSIFPNKEFDFTVYTDASGTGGGGYIKERQNSEFSFTWRHEEASESSTHRELRAILYFITHSINALENKRIKIYCDNQNVVRIVDKGSMNSSLQDLAMKFHTLCSKHAISYITEWIPR